MKLEILKKLGYVPNIYATTVIKDGWGDLGHLLDRIEGLKGLPDDYLRQSAVYILVEEEGGVDRESIVQAKLKRLSMEHPIWKCDAVFINGERFNIGISQVGIFKKSEDSRFESYFRSLDGALIHEVSTNCSSSSMPAYGSVLPYMYTQMGEFGQHNFCKIRDPMSPKSLSPLHNHLGFRGKREGVFLKPPKQFTLESKLELLNAGIGRHSEVLRQAFGDKDVWSKSDVEAFEEETTLVLAYVQGQKFLDMIINQLGKIPSKEKITLILTGHGKIKLDDEYDQERITVINKIGHDQYISGEDYHVLQVFATRDINICSGDKSFEEALSCGSIPIFQVKGIKRGEYTAFLKAVKMIGGESLECKAIIKFLEAYYTEKLENIEVLTQEMCAYWQDKIWPELMKHCNIFKHIPRYEYKAQLVYHLVHNKDLTPEQIVELTKEFSDEELVGVMQEMVDINPYRLRTLLQLISARREACLDILIASNNYDGSPKSDLTILYLFALTSQKDELEETRDKILEKVYGAVFSWHHYAKKYPEISEEIFSHLLERDYGFLPSLLADESRMTVFNSLGDSVLNLVVADVLEDCSVEELPEDTLQVLVTSLSGFYSRIYAHLTMLNIVEEYVKKTGSMPEWMQEIIEYEGIGFDRDRNPVGKDVDQLDRIKTLAGKAPKKVKKPGE